MKRIVIIAVIVLQAFAVTAQNKLSQSERTGGYIYIYRLNPEQMRALFIRSDSISEKYLTDFVMKYRSNRNELYAGPGMRQFLAFTSRKDSVPELGRGNYVLVEAVENRLRFEAHTVDDLRYDFLERDKITLALSDLEGNVVTGAEVRLDGKKFSFDEETALYSLKMPKKERLIEINNNGVYHYVDISGRSVPYGYTPVKVKQKNGFFHKIGRLFKSRDKKDLDKTFKGTVLTGKPKYRPGDTVKMKAYIADGKGKFRDKELEVWLNVGRSEKLISKVKPYRPGFYSYEFAMADSLKLRLDYNYSIEMRNPATQQVYVRGMFNYEDYELGKVTFSARSSKEKYLKGENAVIYLKATDENGMAVYDGRVEMKVLFSGAEKHYAPKTFIPDLLWQKTVMLDTPGEMEIIVPDSVFPGDVSASYYAECEYYSTDNEKQFAAVYIVKSMDPYTVSFDMTHKGLRISELYNGDTIPSIATVTGFANDGKILRSEAGVQLPATVVPHGNIAYYIVTANAFQPQFYYLRYSANNPFNYTFERREGKVSLTVTNNFGYPFRYTVWSGGKVVDRGLSTERSFGKEYPNERSYTARVEYLHGGYVQTGEITLREAGEDIKINIETPLAVYPGQTTDFEVGITDGNGRPVKNADLTALAYTSKFDNDFNYYIPRPLPADNKKREVLRFPYPRNKEFVNPNNRMDWDRWKTEMGLADIEYYKFLRPQPVYSYSEPARDGITQIAPYVVIDGDLQGIDILWIDNLPHYFSKAENRNVYSFRVTPGVHTLRFRTHDRSISLANVEAAEGMKTIVSLDGSANRSEHGIRVDKLTAAGKGKKNKNKQPEISRDLSKAEIASISGYMISVDRSTLGRQEMVGGNYNIPNMAAVKVGSNLTLLSQLQEQPYLYYDYNWNRRGYSGDVLAGPFPYRVPGQLFVNNRPEQIFDIEGGYAYTFIPGTVKMKSWRPNRINPVLQPSEPAVDFTEQVLQSGDIDSINRAQKYRLIQGSLQHFRMSRIPKNVEDSVILTSKNENTGRLNLELGRYEDKTTAVSPLFIRFFNSGDGIYYIYRGRERYFRNLPVGKLRIDLVMEDLSYYSDEVEIKPGGASFMTLDSVKTTVDGKQQVLDRFFAEEFLFREKKYRPKDYSAILEYDPYDPGKFSKDNYDKGLITGFVLDDTGEPLMGAAVNIKGTRIGVTTNADGYFSIKTDSAGILQFNYIGYDMLEMSFKKGYHYNIVMRESLLALEEMVVVGYGVQDKQTLTGRVSGNKLKKSSRSAVEIEDIAYDMAAVAEKSESAGMAPNVYIRGTDTGEKPLIIMNGLPYNGSLEDIPSSSIISMKVLKGEEAVASYGQLGAGGVIIIVTAMQPQEEMSDGQAGMTLRRNFRDDAFWMPELTTDSHGKAGFTVTYPDDITAWKARFYTMTGKGEISSEELLIRSFKALNAQLSMPRFAIEGDRFDAVGKLTNHTGDTVKLEQTVAVGGETFVENIVLANTYTENIPVTVQGTAEGEGMDSVTVRYTIKKEDGFFDGEERTIPIYEQGVMETTGVFEVINDSGQRSYKLDPEKGDIVIHAEASSLETFRREIQKIDEYAYMCNEQMASKVIALVLKKRSSEMFGDKFKEDRKLRQLIDKLNASKNSDNLWGWWNNDGTNIWISKHVIEAMLMAEEEGYSVDFNRELAGDILLGKLRGQNLQGSNRIYNIRDFNQTVMLLHKMGIEADYSNVIIATDTLTGLPLVSKLETMRARQIAGAEISIDSLMSWSGSTMTGGLFWGDKREYFPRLYYYNPYYNNVKATLYAYEILKEQEGYGKELERIRNYFFEERKGGTWRNTYEASSIMAAIMPDMINKGDKYSEVKAVINGETVTEFPYTTASGEHTVTVSKSGTLPLFFTAYQQSRNKNPEAVSEGFKVVTSFIENSDTVTVLKAGLKTEIAVKVTLESDAEYVMIEVPVPAGCSYDNKRQPVFARNEVHREFYKDRVAIFCTRLTAGEHIFRIELLPRFTGEYRLNPARAELMYFPTFYGREGMKEIEIINTEKQ